MRESVGKFSYTLIASFRGRAMSDEKATVRKAAITSWLELLLCNDGNAHEGTFGVGQVTEEDIYRMCQLCGDSSVSVRTTAAGAVYSLIERQHSEDSCDIDILNMLEIAWTDFVLPLILDFESTCVSKAVNMFFSLVIEPILEVAGQSDSPLFEATTFKRKYLSSFKILSRISQSSSGIGASKCVKRALKLALTKIFEQTKSSNQSINEFYSPIFQEVRRLIYNTFDKNYHSVDDELYPTVEISIGVWCLLESIATLASLKQHGKRVDLGKAATQSGIDGKFLVFCWEKTYNICRHETRDENVINTIASSCLCVIKEFAAVTLRRLAEVPSELTVFASQPEFSSPRRLPSLSLMEEPRRLSTLPLPRMTPKPLLLESTRTNMMVPRTSSHALPVPPTVLPPWSRPSTTSSELMRLS